METVHTLPPSVPVPAMLPFPALLSPSHSKCCIHGPRPPPRAPLPSLSADILRSYAAVPANAGLAREVIKWLQSLDLSYPFKSVRNAFCNGYLVAEIFSWYYPQDVDVSVFNNGVSFPSKLKNWSQLERFFFKRKFNIPKELIDATIHSKPRGAICLIQHIYTLLTNRQAKYILDDELNFMDYSYQQKLPMVARATVSNAIRTNLRLTEVLEQPDHFTNKQKALDIINMHVQQRQLARLEQPKTMASEIRSKTNVLFKETNVKQVVRNS
uniref:spermatogenesis-associated protein 4 isoform X2 n=1 Tax=Pristiophorus japonicus TaxID=55135 RepID=UPI00398E704A